jgi:5'-nucleotidase
MMRRRLAVWAALVVLGGCAPATPPAAAPAATRPRAPVTLSIVGTNDLHGGILPANDRGGLAILGGYLRNLRAARAADGAVLLIDAGDMWQGTMESNLTEGAVVVEAYNQLGYAAATIGNHEFDFGPAGAPATPRSPADDPRGALKARAAEARFPFVAANIIDRATGRPVDWPNVTPSTTVTAAGVTVGIVGLTTRTTFRETIRANTVGLSLAPLAGTIATEAGRLRASGADVVIVTAHAGGRCRAFDDPADLSSCDEASEIVRVARALAPGLVDVIVAGHAHGGMAHEVNGMAVIESFSRGRSFGRVDLVVDPAEGRVLDRRIFPPQDLCLFAEPGSTRCAEGSGTGVRPPAVYEGAPVEPDAAIEATLAPAIARVAALKAEPLGVVAASVVSIRGEVESPLGNLFTDAMLAGSGGADLAINNTDGGLRADLPAGPVTYGRLFEVFPFDNQLVRLTLTGRDLERVLAGHFGRSSQLLGLAGGRVEAGCTGGGLSVRIVRAGGAEIRDDETVVVVTTDYLATTELFDDVRAPDGDVGTGPIVRDVVADWLRRRGGVLNAEALVDARAPRFPPRSALPIRCWHP